MGISDLSASINAGALTAAVPLIPANILVNSTAKKLVDSAICAILYLEVQIVQNVRHFAILVSINVPVYVKLAKTDVQYPILHRHQPLLKLQLFLNHQMIKPLEPMLLLKHASIMPHSTVKKHADFAICVPLHQLVPNVQPFANLAKKNVRNSANLAKIDV